MGCFALSAWALKITYQRKSQVVRAPNLTESDTSQNHSDYRLFWDDVHASLDPDKVASIALRLATEFFRAEGALVWWPSTENATLESENGLWHQIGLENVEAAILEVLMLNPKPPDAGNEPVRLPYNGRELFLTPIVARGQSAGWFGVARSEPLNDHEAGIVVNVGASLGTAIGNAIAHQKAKKKAMVDSVTGLPNSRALHDRLATEVALASETGTELSVLLVDLDNFRMFNATHGLPNGDAILRRAAQVLSVGCPNKAWVGRYGGDEFLVVLPGHGREEAKAAAVSLETNLELEGFQLNGDDRTIPIRSDIGVATLPSDGQTLHALLSAADRNLSAAKKSDGRIAATDEGHLVDSRIRTDASFAALETLVIAIDKKDAYTRRHSEHVADIGLWMAQEMGCSQETQRVVRAAAILHDVGKIAIPTPLLLKPGRLDDAEYETLRRHPVIGGQLLEALPGMEQMVEGVRSHHEHWDGSGYPDGLAGNSIPWLGRLLAVADAYSSMISDRPYRKAMGQLEAIKRLQDHAGIQFDPYMVQILVRALNNRKPVSEFGLWRDAA